MSCDDQPAVRRAAGRPRSEAADAAILDAALAEFAACGFDGMRIEAVAARAGVAKTTLYRRFPTKLGLVHHALATTADELPCPHTDSLVDDLVVLATQLRDRFACPRLGVVVPALVQAISRHEDLRELHLQFLAERRRQGLARLTAAVGSGELPEGTDLHLLLDQVVGTVFYRTFVSGGALDDADIRVMVTATIDGHRVQQGA
jgi:AcrR family transcriptional regulator